MKKRQNDAATFDMSLINKSAKWPPNYSIIKQSERFPKPDKQNKLQLNETANIAM